MSDMLKLGILVAGLCITLAACNTRNKSACNIHPTDLREGDVIFRRGTSANSRMVTLLQGFYSHVGIVADSSGHGDLRIVHAVPDEPESFEILEIMRSEGTAARVKDGADYFAAARLLCGVYFPDDKSPEGLIKVKLD